MSTPDDIHDATLARLYRQLPAEEPSAAVDARILAAAQAAADAQTAAGQLRRPSRWQRLRAPFALAATVVLAVGVLWQQRSPEEEAVPAAVQSAARELAAVERTAPAQAPLAEAMPAPEAVMPEPPPAVTAAPQAPAVVVAREAAADHAMPVELYEESRVLSAAPAPRAAQKAKAEAQMDAAASSGAARIAVSPWPWSVEPGMAIATACARIAPVSVPGCLREGDRVLVPFDGVAGTGMFSGAAMASMEMSVRDERIAELRIMARSGDVQLPARIAAALLAAGWQAQPDNTFVRLQGNRQWRAQVHRDGEEISLHVFAIATD